MTTTSAALADPSRRNEMRNRYVRAARASARYQQNIALTASYQNTAMGRGGEAKADARKYSQSTYMGLRAAKGSNG